MSDPEWLEKVKKTQRFHASKCREHNGYWKLKDTAKELKRSVGSVSEHLLVATWLRTHSDKIEKCKSLNDAIDFIQDKKRNLSFEDLDE